MIKFGERIKELGKRLGKEDMEIASAIGVSKSTMSHYINGRRKVPSEALQRLVDVYKINPQFLFSEEAPLYSEVVAESTTQYNIEKSYEYNYFPTAISAGLPFEVEGITKSEKISVPNTLMGRWAGNEEIFLTKIYGDSMDKLMQDGSLIAVKPTPIDTLKDGDVVVFNDEHGYSVKHYYKHGDKLVFKPSSTNNAHYDQTYSINDNITIHGKVVMWVVTTD